MAWWSNNIPLENRCDDATHHELDGAVDEAREEDIRAGVKVLSPGENLTLTPRSTWTPSTSVWTTYVFLPGRISGAAQRCGGSDERPGHGSRVAGRTTQMGEADSGEVVDRYDCEYTRNVVVD